MLLMNSAAEFSFLNLFGELTQSYLHAAHIESTFSTGSSIVSICLVSLSQLLISLISAAGKGILFDQCSSRPTVK